VDLVTWVYNLQELWELMSLGLTPGTRAGAHIVIDARKGDKVVVEEVHGVTNGEGANATVNVSDAKTAAATACAVTKMHGRMIQIAQVRMSFPCIGPQLIFTPARTSLRPFQ
jgi:propanol-preferring alcohol dehydrogenase